MQSRGGPERERERARTWRWRQLSRGGREGCGDAESGRECGRQGPESLRPAWGAWLSPRGRSWVAGGSQPFACSRDRSLRSHEQVSVPPGLQRAGGARWRRRPSRRVGLTRKAVAGLARPAEPPPRQEKCAHRGRLQTITRGPERHPPLSLPGCPGAVLRSRAGGCSVSLRAPRAFTHDDPVSGSHAKSRTCCLSPRRPSAGPSCGGARPGASVGRRVALRGRTLLYRAPPHG